MNENIDFIKVKVLNKMSVWSVYVVFVVCLSVFAVFGQLNKPDCVMHYSRSTLTLRI